MTTEALNTPAAGENGTVTTNTEAPSNATAPVHVNLGLGELIHGLLAGPKAETEVETKPAEAPAPEVEAKPDDKPADKGPTKAELRDRVAQLEAEKTQSAVLDGLRDRLAPGMEPAVRRLLPTLDLSTPDTAKAALDQLAEDVPALFKQPSTEASNTNNALFNLPAAGNKPAAPVMRRNR